MSPSTIEPLTLAEAQRIAESIVGPVQWRGAEGACTCPGIANHTTHNAASDCKVVAERIGELAPGCYCFHESCRAEVEAASYALRSALGKRSPSSAPRIGSPFIATPRKAPATFRPDKLERLARKLNGVDADWFAARSPKRVTNRTPASFLHELYLPGEKVLVFDVFKSQGQHLWQHRAPFFDAGELDGFTTGKPQGVWFLSNPVSGRWLENRKNADGTPHYSRRFEGVVTSWRYLVLESDRANPEHWLAALGQLPLPISAIYSSGGKSIHALVRLNAGSKAEWDALTDELKPMKPMLVMLGADRAAMKAVQLTRLPGCERVEKRQLQKLLFFNPDPDQTPICELPINAGGLE